MRTPPKDSPNRILTFSKFCDLIATSSTPIFRADQVLWDGQETAIAHSVETAVRSLAWTMARFILAECLNALLYARWGTATVDAIIHVASGVPVR